MSIDTGARVLASGDHRSGQAVAVAGQGGEPYGVPRPSIHECWFCEFRSTAEGLLAHAGLMHRERVAAQVAYDAVLAAGAPVEDARARYNAVVRAAIEGGPGRYKRVKEARG